jgi:hypothetical protein
VNAKASEETGTEEPKKTPKGKKVKASETGTEEPKKAAKGKKVNAKAQQEVVAASEKKEELTVVSLLDAEEVKNNKEETELEREPEEEEEVEVEEFVYEGVKYLKSSKGVVYDVETSEEIGVWNERSQRIEVD